MAFSAGDVARRLERWISPRGLLVGCIVLQGVAYLLPLVFRGQWVIWTAACVVNGLAAIAWPLIEAYVTAGRHGPAMRSAIARFNLVWMPAVAVPMIAMAPILDTHGRWAIGALVLSNAAALVALPGFRPRPSTHDADEASAHVPPVYPRLLQSARVLLPVSYVVTSAMSPILPYRFEQLGVEVWWETPSTATWMIVRVLAVIVMWRLPFWHGRWGTLLLGAIATVMGFALVVLAPTLAVMLAGFAVLGVGLGMIYYAALYYAMAVGRAAVEAGGTHEALIGCGYAVGPLAGLLGAALGGGAATVAVVWTIMAASTVPAARPYRRAKAEKQKAKKQK
jgi:hypothetical protein